MKGQDPALNARLAGELAIDDARAGPLQDQDSNDGGGARVSTRPPVDRSGRLDGEGLRRLEDAARMFQHKGMGWEEALALGDVADQLVR